MKKTLLRFSLLSMLMLLCIGSAYAADVTATWSFRSGSKFFTTPFLYQGGTGNAELESDVEGIKLIVDATSGKFATQGRSDWAQINATTILKVPVKTTKDVVKVVTYSANKAKIGGGIITTDQTGETSHKATTAEVTAGYVDIVATANDYIGMISVTHVDPLQEKQIYAPDFGTWESYEENIDNGTPKEHKVDFTTKFSKESNSLTLWQTNVYMSGKGKVSKSTSGYLCGMKANAPENNATITTQPFASVTKVKYFHIATGNNRGWGLKVKGTKADNTQDEDWVTVYSTTTNSSGTAVEVLDINRTNVQLQFYNLSQSNYASIYNLEIYGMVDLSKQPMLGSFEANGVKYYAADIFDEDAEGNNVATIELSKTVPMVDETSNPLTNIVADNGEIKSVTYTPANGGCKVTFVIEAAGKTANYIATFVPKPDYTLSYYNLDGSLIGSQIREKDQTIGTFDYGVSDVTGVPEGFKFRGWFIRPAANVKYSEDEVVLKDLSLYARATKIEDGTGNYIYNLTDAGFDPTVHDAITIVGTGKPHSDIRHGWVFATGDQIKLAIGGDAKISVTGCRYSAEGKSVTVSSETGTVSPAEIPIDRNTDGVTTTVDYKGTAGEVVLTMTGTTYIHGITVVNLTSDIAKETAGYHVVKAGDANSLLDAIAYASATNTTADAAPMKIFVPNGTYNLGETVLTKVSGYNIAIIGESQNGVKIINAPDMSNEGIGTTATLYNTSSNFYLQDVTLQNALDYYNSGSAGRAVCLWDQGNMNIYKRVTMLSYQDTYYSNNDQGKQYWADSEIHGTVDFICGGGDILFENTKLYVEPRAKDGSGECTITAPTTATTYGYVFNNCTIENHANSYNLGRSWQNSPKAVYLNTKMNQQPIESRWNLTGMNGIDMAVAAEYNSRDMDGNDVTPPAGTTQTFKNKKTVLTIVLTAEQAANYTSANMFGEWAPETLAAQLEAPEATYDSGNVTWTPANNGATAYLIEKDGEFAGITTGSTFAITIDVEKEKLTIRAANGRGGFGEAKQVEGTATGIHAAKAATERGEQVIYNLAGQRVSKATQGLYIVNGQKVILK